MGWHVGHCCSGINNRESCVTTHAAKGEGLKVARLLMVLSSISPLFIIWAIRGTRLIPDLYFVSGCILLVIVPNLFLWLRMLLPTLI